MSVKRKTRESIQQRTLRETLSQNDKISAILKQTTLTNGRVTLLENTVKPLVAIYARAVSVWGVLLVIVPLIVGELLKVAINRLWP